MLLSFTAKISAQVSAVEDDIIKTSLVTTDAQIYNLPATQKQTTIQYFDGLGRPIQTVAQTASPAQKDIIQPEVYDNLGRQTANYLPYADETGTYVTGQYRPNALIGDQANFYNQTGQHLIATDAAPFNQAVFENSPLQRMTSDGMIGTGYQPTNASLSGGSGTQYFKTTSYRSNTTNDGNILIWNSDGSYTAGNYYLPGQLAVTDGKDEANNETLVFADFAGRVILKRQVNGNSNADTYHIYDNAGMLTFVIPPGALALMVKNGSYSTKQTGVSSMIFQFVYDAMGRMIQKTVPAKGIMSIVYDPLSRPVLLQDAYLNSLNEWNYIRYDVKGRVISQGIYTDATSTRLGLAAMQTYVNSLSASYQTAWYETKNTTLTSGYYTANIFPTTATGTLTPLAFAYFDNYTLTSGRTYKYSTQGLGTFEETATTAPVKGMPTMVRTAPVGPGIAASIIKINVTFYDKRLHPIQTQSNNQLYAGTNVITDYSTIAPDFTGVTQVAQTSKTILTPSGNTVTTTVQTSYIYDQMNRVLNVSQAYNGGSSQQVAAYSYNEMGRVVLKGLGQVGAGSIPANISTGTYNTTTLIASTSINLIPGFSVPSGSALSAVISNSYLQSVDYRYNIRGQLTSINNSQLANDNGVTNNDNSDLFGMNLFYDKQDAILQNSTYHNAYLSAIEWMSKDGNGNNSAERALTYNYDALNRYSSSVYSEMPVGGSSFNANVGEYSEAVTYTSDNSGNIQSLTRGPSAAQIDNLTYTYDPANPNQVHTVTDATGNNQGFYNLTGVTTPYKYDTNNGNLINDYYKGLQIGYNSINRTQKISVIAGTGEWIDYTYDASGNILRKRQYNNSTLQTTTDYIDGFVFVTQTTGTPTLSYFPMPEGRVVNNGGTLTQEFIITDQQGNARVAFNNTGTGGTAKLIQENSYYGTGLTIQPLVTGDDNKKLYNGGSEWQNDFGNLPDYYQTFYRDYDPATARFISVDPDAESAASITSYQYANDNPIMMNDPLGNYAPNGYTDLQWQLQNEVWSENGHGHPHDVPQYDNITEGDNGADLLSDGLTGNLNSSQVQSFLATNEFLIYNNTTNDQNATQLLSDNFGYGQHYHFNSSNQVTSIDHTEDVSGVQNADIDGVSISPIQELILAALNGLITLPDISNIANHGGAEESENAWGATATVTHDTYSGSTNNGILTSKLTQYTGIVRGKEGKYGTQDISISGHQIGAVQKDQISILSLSHGLTESSIDLNIGKSTYSLGISEEGIFADDSFSDKGVKTGWRNSVSINPSAAAFGVAVSGVANYLYNNIGGLVEDAGQLQ